MCRPASGDSGPLHFSFPTYLTSPQFKKNNSLMFDFYTISLKQRTVLSAFLILLLSPSKYKLCASVYDQHVTLQMSVSLKEALKSALTL